MVDKVDFEVVKIYYGDIYTGYCTKPVPGVGCKTVEEHYAIKIGDDYYILGEKGVGIYVSEIKE